MHAWRRAAAALVGLACASRAGWTDDAASSTEDFSRRACKFRPLPRSLSEGYSHPDGTAQVSDVFGVPLVSLARGGHSVTGEAPSDAYLGLAVQIPYATSSRLSVKLTQGSEARECLHTWGAGGKLKQCVFEGVTLDPGAFTLTFGLLGIGGDGEQHMDGLMGASSCLSVRLELEVALRETMDRAGRCEGEARLPPPLGGQQAWSQVLRTGGEVGAGSFSAPATFSAPVGTFSTVWSSPVPAVPGAGAELVMLYARLGFISLTRPLQLLLEEVDRSSPWKMFTGDSGGQSEHPMCMLRCVGGTPVTGGQVLQHLLPAGVGYRLWIMGSGSGRSGCDNFDFEARATAAPASKMQEYFLGPPAWLCEGAPWPSRLEQLPTSAPLLAPAEDAHRARRLHLHDVLELTRPPHADRGGGSQVEAGDLRVLQLKVAEYSVLRLTTDAATVPVRPVLVEGRVLVDGKLVLSWQQLSHQSRWPAAQIPMAGGEVRHSIHADLSPGEYTLFFVTDFAAGGLRPCASVLLRLELVSRHDLDEAAASASVGDVTHGRCAEDAGKGVLDDLAARWSSPLEKFVEREQDFQVTLPAESLPARRGVVSLMRSEVYLAADKPFMLRASVSSPFAEADVGVQIFAGIVAVGVPRPAEDGDGYTMLAGPFVKPERFAVELFHVPRLPTSDSPQTRCVTLSVDLAALQAQPEPASLARALPGSAGCRLSGTELPAQLAATAGRPAVLEGEFLLPSNGMHNIEVTGGSSTGPWLVRAWAASEDAEVRVDVTTGAGGAGTEQRSAAGRREDFHLLWTSSDQTANVALALERLPTPTVCPTLRLHVVVMALSDVPPCSDAGTAVGLVTSGAREQLGRSLLPQAVDAAQLRTTVLPLPGAGVDLQVPFGVHAATAELRLELGVQPPWLPLEVTVQDSAGQEGSRGSVWARGRPAGERLVVLAPSLPKGRYQLRLRSWARVTPPAGKSSSSLAERCARVSVAAALLQPSGRDDSNFRQEMLNLPELLAVTPLPPSLTPSWLRPSDRLLASQMYAVPSTGAVTTVRVDAPSRLRLLAEPADILAPHPPLEGRRDSVGGQVMSYPTELIGGTEVTLSSAGTYFLRFQPGGDLACPNCVHQSLPFYFTVGLAQQQQARDFGCAARPPVRELLALGLPPPLEEGAHGWRQARRLRVQGLPETISIPVDVPWPSVVLVGTWSDFVGRHVRVAFKTEEGLWVGEQRMGTSALEIELPPGRYSMQVEEPSRSWAGDSGCMDFGVMLSQVALHPHVSPPPFNFALGVPRARAGAPATGPLGAGLVGAALSVSMGARCDALGASPLPLDVLSASGGSAGIGGPMDKDGRLLVRHKVMLTNIHDGRKKVFLRPRPGSLLRLAVVSGDAAQVEVALENSQHGALAPEIVHSHGASGWSASYDLWRLLGQDATRGLWLSFHREHQDAHESGCASFELILQVSLAQDATEMAKCTSAETTLLELSQRALASGDAEGTVRLPNNGVVEATLELPVSEPSLVELEVQFNFLLSDVQMWLQFDGDASPEEEIATHIGAANEASAPRNARAVLRFWPQAGRHWVHLRHRSAWSRSAGCVPMRISVRQSAWATGGGVVVAAGVQAAPVHPTSDIMMVVLSPKETPDPELLTVGGLKPDGVAQFAGGLVCTWNQQRFAEEGGSSRPLSDGLLALPVGYAGTSSGEVVVLTDDHDASPWSGVSRPSTSMPARPWILRRPDRVVSSGAVIQEVPQPSSASRIYTPQRQVRRGQPLAALQPAGVQPHEGMSNIGDDKGGGSQLGRAAAWALLLAAAAVLAWAASEGPRRLQRLLRSLRRRVLGEDEAGKELASMVEIVPPQSGVNRDWYRSCESSFP